MRKSGARKLLFLPGAGGSPNFWRPVADCLPSDWIKLYFAWPGLGDQPPDPNVAVFDDLMDLVQQEIDGPVDLVAHSIGGVIAAKLALTRPNDVRRLVLSATSGGVDMKQFGASDWRPDYRRNFPNAAAWIFQTIEILPIERIVAPTLLIWGEADNISPISVGSHLQQRIPSATLRIVPGGGHDVPSATPDVVAALIRQHLSG